MRRFGGLLCALAMASCAPPGSDGGPVDLGLDGGPTDAGPMDAGPMDAGSIDAGLEQHIEEAEADVHALAQAAARERTDTGSESSLCLTNLSNLLSATCPSPCGNSLPSCADAAPGDTCWDGPYIDSLPDDPWGLAYWAELNQTTFAVTVGSSGPDRTEGTPDDITATE